MMAMPCNMGGDEAYRRLYQLVRREGYRGDKIYLDAYIRQDGRLRIMLGNVRPVQPW